MLNKKKKDDELSTGQQLEAKVDAMMKPQPTDAPKAADKPTPLPVEEPVKKASKSTPPPIDIFAETKTAPEIPQKLGSDSKIEKDTPVPPPVPATEDPHATTVDQVTDEKPASSTDLEEPFNDRQTDEAVQDITREEADKVLEAEDHKTNLSNNPKPPKKGVGQRLKSLFAVWWRNKATRYSTLTILFAFVVGTGAWPTSRYAILNTAGVRSGASLKILDQSTGLPLKKVDVQLGNKTATTDNQGVAAFNNLRLGPQQLKVERVAFASVRKNIVVGWGSNPLGEFKLEATGAQYVFNVTDYLSTKAVTTAEAVSGDASAFADKKGKIVLTVEEPAGDTMTVTLRADDYRTEKLTFPVNTKEAFNTKMAAGQSLVYVSKQAGKYDLYKIDADGKNKKLLLAGTGSERQAISVVSSPDGRQAALVSSRGPKRDSSGYLLDTLTLIDVQTGKTKTIDEAQSIRPVDWINQRLVYLATYGASSAATADRQRIVSYNTEESARTVLTTADYFNSITSADGFIYYAVAASDPKQSPIFQKIRPDASGKLTVLNKQVWNVQRLSIDEMALETEEGWYDYTIGESIAEKGQVPADPHEKRHYFMAPNGTRSARVENRDGKGALLVSEKADVKREKVFTSASGLALPIRWLNKDVLVYRVAHSGETADYVRNLEGGEAKKVTDVTATSGLSGNL